MIALLAKELREHGLAMALLAFMSGSLFVVSVIFYLLDPDRLGMMHLYLRFLVMGSIMAGLIISHLLVSREYSQKTQFFLETLPLSRLTVFAVKWFLGLWVSLALQSVFFGTCVLLAGQGEGLTATFLAIVAARSVTWLILLHAFFFAFGLLGRYRIFSLLVFFISIMVVETSSQIRLSDVGPFGLVFDGQFAIEREIFPMANICIGLLFSALFVLLSVFMIRSREGSMAAAVAQAMSHREKIFIAACLFASIVASSIFQERQEAEPYTLMNATVVEEAGVSVGLAETGLLDEEEPRAFVNWLHAELMALKEYLGLPELPEVFITVRRDLDQGKYEWGHLEDNEGLLIRANYDPATWDRQAFLAWLVPKLILEQSDGRADLERNRWLLDGFGLYWLSSRGGSSANTHRYLLRALYGTPEGLSPEDLDHWFTYKEHVGLNIAQGVGWFGLNLFADTYGAEKLQTLLRRKLCPVLPHDFRATLDEYRYPLSAVVREISSFSYDHFIATWDRELRHRGRELASELAGLPRLDGSIKLVRLTDATHALEFQLAAPLDPETRVNFRHTVLSFEQRDIKLDQVKREEMPFSRLATWNRLPLGFTTGARLAWSFEVLSPELGCEIGTGWSRLEVP